MGWSYSKAGLDLSKHRSMHSYALELLKGLAKELGAEIKGLGGYSTSIRMGNLDLVLHVDGVGTKTLVLERLGRLRVAGWDCVAMNVNDVACDGCKPIALVDYVAMPSDDPRVFGEIVEGLVDAARYARVPVLGGETAVLRDLVNGVDVVCTVLAVKAREFENRARAGDVVVGVESWGLHSNGYTLVRRIVESSVGDYRAVVDGVDLGVELSKPTAIYSNMVLEAIEENLVNSVAHVTGGAFTKVKRVLEKNDMVLDMPEPPKIFEVIMRLGGVDVAEMYRVFNMGVGLVMTTLQERVDQLIRVVGRHGFRAYVLGRVVEGEGRIRLRLVNGAAVTL